MNSASDFFAANFRYFVNFFWKKEYSVINSLSFEKKKAKKD